MLYPDKRESYHSPCVEWITLLSDDRILNNSIDPSYEDDKEEWGA